MLKKSTMFILVIALVFPALAVRADDVTDSLREAEKQYNSKNYTEAVKELEFATQLIRQKKSENVKKLMPEALPGWTAGEAKATTAGSMYLGGGIKVTRKYTRGDEEVSIELTMDNPMMQTFMAAMNNPMLAGPDAKLTRIHGQRGILKFNSSNQRGELNIAFQQKVLISVKGDNLETDKVLVDYAKLLDFKRIEGAIMK